MRSALPFLVLATVAPLLCSCGGRIDSKDEPTGLVTVPGQTATPTPTRVPPPDLPPSTPSKPPPPPTDPDSTSYSAFASAGGLDHLEIFKADYAADTCTRIHLTDSGSPLPAFPLTIGDEFVVQDVVRSKGAGLCKPQSMNPGSAANAGKGTISWPGLAVVFPCKLSIHAVVLFSGEPAEQLDAEGVAVSGCM